MDEEEDEVAVKIGVIVTTNSDDDDSSDDDDEDDEDDDEDDEYVGHHKFDTSHVDKEEEKETESVVSAPQPPAQTPRTTGRIRKPRRPWPGEEPTDDEGTTNGGAKRGSTTKAGSSASASMRGMAAAAAVVAAAAALTDGKVADEDGEKEEEKDEDAKASNRGGGALLEGKEAEEDRSSNATPPTWQVVGTWSREDSDDETQDEDDEGAACAASDRASSLAPSASSPSLMYADHQQGRNATTSPRIPPGQYSPYSTASSSAQHQHQLTSPHIHYHSNAPNASSKSPPSLPHLSRFFPAVTSGPSTSTQHLLPPPHPSDYLLPPTPITACHTPPRKQQRTSSKPVPTSTPLSPHPSSMGSNPRKPFVCTVPFCNKAYKKLNGLINHGLTAHSSAGAENSPSAPNVRPRSLSLGTAAPIVGRISVGGIEGVRVALGEDEKTICVHF
ncbi:hypothetical protein BC829DRAFT_443399 [Chytridium lagenaria]|nr:hypothetical protein BC829DRAFT_443399 [Chytridium lagenaria]